MADSTEQTLVRGETRANTPASIYLALLLFAFTIAAPFIGEYSATHGRHDGWGALQAFLPWMLAGATAAFIGIICTIVGARRAPRSGFTILAVLLASLATLMFLMLLGLSLTSR
jgi:uncharacterized oligopeptide transporter (OPT) family protein